jgi:transcriptional regulator with XRE-family HTH domain
VPITHLRTTLDDMEKQIKKQEKSLLYRVVGETIRRTRTAKSKITQKELSVRVGLNRTSIAKIEAGEQRFALDTLYRFSSALGVPVSALLPKPEQLTRNASDEKGILSRATAPEGLKQEELDSILSSITEAIGK